MSGNRTLTVWDLKNIIDLMQGDYQIPEFNRDDYMFLCHPYTPAAYVGRTALNGKGCRYVSDDKEWYRPRSRCYNWRWAKKKRDILKGTYVP